MLLCPQSSSWTLGEPMSLTGCSWPGNSHQPWRPHYLLLLREAILASMPLPAPQLVSLCICLTFISKVVLVFHGCVTNHYKLVLIQHKIIISVSMGQEFWHNVTGCSVRGLARLKSRVTWICELIWGSGSSPKLTSCWQNSVLCVCKVLVFLLACGRGSCLSFRGHLYLSDTWPRHSHNVCF